jgi:hypothetical protein
MTGPNTPPTDPDAPYGRYERGARAGQPRLRPARPSGRTGRRPGRPRKDAAPAAPPRSSSPRPPSATGAGAAASKLQRARTEAALGAVQLLTFPLGFVPDPTGVIALDIAAVSLHAQRLCAGVAKTAERVPMVALALDRLAVIGPYADAITGATALVAQIAVNHGAPIDSLRKMGAVSRERLQAWLIGQARDQAEQDQAALAAEAAAFDQLLADAAAAGAVVDEQNEPDDQDHDPAAEWEPAGAEQMAAAG